MIAVKFIRSAGIKEFYETHGAGADRFYSSRCLSGAQGTWDFWLKNEGYYLLGPKKRKNLRLFRMPKRRSMCDDLWAALDPNHPHS